MYTGHFVNALLYACWALSIAGGMNFYMAQSVKDKRIRRIVLMMAVATSMWSMFCGALGFATEESMARGCFGAMIICFDVYALSLALFVGRLLNMRGIGYSVYLIIGIVFSVLDTVIYAFADIHEFTNVNGRTAFYTRPSWAIGYHLFFILFMFVALLILALGYARKSKLKRKRVFVINAAAFNAILLVASIPDTLLPLLGIPSFPSAGYAVCFTFIMMIFLAQKNNTFSISQRNLTDAIYHESKIGVLVLSYKGRVTDMNGYAAKLLDLDVMGEYELDEVLCVTDEQMQMILNGEDVLEHIKSRKTDIPLTAHSVVYKDSYGDTFGIALMLVDSTAEEKVIKQLIEIQAAEEKREGVEKMSHQLVEALSKSIDAKDKYTNGHSHRVAEYSVMIAKKMGYNDEQLHQMEYSALLHDVGKIGVPNAIINKPGKLTDEEYEIIKTHPALGDNILSDIMEIPQIRIGARWHHERYDGKGYPDGIKGEEIPELARIIAMADAYDAMTSNRSYRKYLSQEIVRSEVEKGRGSQFDPEIADIMLSIMDEDTEYVLHEPDPDIIQ